MTSKWIATILLFTLRFVEKARQIKGKRDDDGDKRTGKTRMKNDDHNNQKEKEFTIGRKGNERDRVNGIVTEFEHG